MTDLSTLTLPKAKAAVESAIKIRTEWWSAQITGRGLPGTPPSEREMTRIEVWTQANDVFTLLWRSLAWGSGPHLRLNARRLESVAEDVPRCEDLLTRAAELSRSDPAAAYSLLRPGDRNAIRYLGPSFFTKFLYFAGRGAPDHPCLILDRRVATTLHEQCGWTSLHRAGPWPAETYKRYCGLLARWAQEHHCTPDQLELKLFKGFSADQN